MRRFIFAAVAVVTPWVAGCEPVVVRDPVTVVNTRTPGVAFVVVRPGAVAQTAGQTQPGDGVQVQGNSDYVLLCDARPIDGMRCEVVSEAAVARFSYTPNSAVAAQPIDYGIGTLTHLDRIAEDGSREEQLESDSSATGPAATGSTGAQPEATTDDAASTAEGGQP